MKRLKLTRKQLKENIIYWIIPVFGCVEPQMAVGPFLTYEDMLKRAKKIKATQSDDDALFYSRTQYGKTPEFNCFSAAAIAE